MIALQSANLALRFLLELIALFAVGYWGFRLDRGLLLRVCVGIGAPLLVAVLWGLFGAPHASMKLSGAKHALLEAGVFGLPAVALYAAGRPSLAWVYGLVVVANRLLMYVWGQ